MGQIDNAILSKEWVKSAYYDLENIRYIINADHLTHIVAFHSQQAIEKLFKALIVKNSNNLPKTHDLLKLTQKVKDKIEITDRKTLEELNELYIDSRYPNSFALMPHGKPTLEDAKRYYNFASEIFENVANYLGIKTNFN